MKVLRKMILVTTLCWAGAFGVQAQCSICTKTAQQLGKESAEGLNSGIVYLMLLPFAVAGFIGYRWWQNEKASENQTEN